MSEFFEKTVVAEIEREVPVITNLHVVIGAGRTDNQYSFPYNIVEHPFFVNTTISPEGTLRVIAVINHWKELLQQATDIRYLQSSNAIMFLDLEPNRQPMEETSQMETLFRIICRQEDLPLPDLITSYQSSESLTANGTALIRHMLLNQGSYRDLTKIHLYSSPGDLLSQGEVMTKILRKLNFQNRIYSEIAYCSFEAMPWIKERLKSYFLTEDALNSRVGSIRIMKEILTEVLSFFFPTGKLPNGKYLTKTSE